MIPSVIDLDEEMSGNSNTRRDGARFQTWTPQAAPRRTRDRAPRARRAKIFSLHSLDPGQVCRLIGSTGLYPYAVVDRAERIFEARQFPRSSGYPEDAATGIAAAALAFGLLADATIDGDDQMIRIFQGRAMGQLSEIRVRLGFAGGRAIGCLIGGAVTLIDASAHLSAHGTVRFRDIEVR